MCEKSQNTYMQYLHFLFSPFFVFTSLKKNFIWVILLLVLTLPKALGSLICVLVVVALGKPPA
jgi:hypothetical protein